MAIVLVEVVRRPGEINGAPDESIPRYKVTGIDYARKVASHFPILLRAVRQGNPQLLKHSVKDVFRNKYLEHREARSVPTHVHRKADGIIIIKAGRGF